MMNRKSWMAGVVGCVAGALCMSQAWSANLTCVELNVSNNSEASLLAAVQGLGDFSSAQNVFKDGSAGLTVNGLGSTSGDYSYVVPANMDVLGYILKAGNNAVFCITSDAIGYWDTNHEFLAVGNGPLDPEGGIRAPDLSFFAIVTTQKSVPEPASALAGLLTLGLGVLGWKRMRQAS